MASINVLVYFASLFTGFYFFTANRSLLVRSGSFRERRVFLHSWTSSLVIQRGSRAFIERCGGPAGPSLPASRIKETPRSRRDSLTEFPHSRVPAATPVQQRHYVSSRKRPLLHLLDEKREQAVFYYCRVMTEEWIGIFIYIIILNPKTRRCLPEITDINALAL